MNQRSGCPHKWVKHGDKSFYCSECGYFIETLEELEAVLAYERKKVISEVGKIVEEINCEHKEQLKEKLKELK